MSNRKYPIMDEDFLQRMIGACTNSKERGLIFILDASGMHVSALSNVTLLKRGERHYLSWVRPKTHQTLEVLAPKNALDDIQKFLETKKKSRQTYLRWVNEIGRRAGYEGVSPMTFRHNRCIRSIKLHNYNPFIVAQDMGCSIPVVFRNYSKLREDQLNRSETDPREVQ